MNFHVVVVGGGFAGAAAASALTEAGVSVTLLEARPTLGGRAGSLRDGVTREEVDNGQHLFMACYRDTRQFLRRLKVEDRLAFLPGLRVPFVTPGGRRSVLNCSSWPRPWGLLWGLARFGEFTFQDRWSLVRGLATHGWGRVQDLKSLTVAQWLDRLRQSPGSRRAFWTPLCLAALNERPERACAEAFHVVLREAFWGERGGGALGYAKVSLVKLWAVELAAYLKRQGGKVAPNQNVVGFRVEGRRVLGVRLANGETVEADAVICAVSLPAFLKICPAPLRPHYKGLEGASCSAIASVNFWFSKPLFEEPYLGFLDTRIQWAFNRHRLWGGLGASPGYVSLVISGASEHAGLSGAELMRLALEDLRKCFPSLQEEPRHGTVVWERHATPSPSPAFWGRRPPVETALENFFLAGDWVDSGLPPTIEAACRSGHRAARGARDYLESRTPAAAGPS